VHEEFVADAIDLIKEDGRLMHLVTLTGTGPTYDPRPSETLTPIIGVQTEFMSEEIDGELIVRGDKRFLFDGRIAVTNDMRIRDNGIDYSVVDPGEVKPGEVVVLYRTQARR